MKKKRFCFKRAVSLLLAAAMILTAAPQTGTTAFAAENSDTSADPQVLSVDDTLADEENNENDTDVDTTQPEDGQDETQLPEESGDGSENGGDVLPEDPDQEGNPDDAEEPGEVTEPADEQEGDVEDAEGIASEEETVSENTLAVELMENDSTEGEEKPEYNGETKKDSDGDWEYNRLVISAFEGGGLSDTRIVEILGSYKNSEQRFECVQLDMKDTGSKKIKKEILNAAIGVLNTDHNYKDENDDGEGVGEPRYWIDYNFYKESSEEEKESTNFVLDRPGTVGADINANVTVTPVAGQGVKLKFPAVNFNANNVEVSFNNLPNSGVIKECLARAEGERYDLFTVKSGQFEAYDESSYNGGYNASDNRFWVCDARRLKANTEYLMAPVADLGSINAGETKEWKINDATNVKGKSYTPDIASISITGNTAVLSAWEEGEALFGVTYKAGSVTKAEFYCMRVGRELYKIDFLEKEIEMEVGNDNYLNVVCYPSDAGIDPGDLTWAMDPKDSQVIKFVQDENDGKMRGGIEALNPGTVTVTATYQKENEEDPQLQSNETTDDPFTATCEITVKGRLEWKDVESDVENMHLYAVSGCDTKLSDVKFPDETKYKWEWKDPELSLAPYAGMEGHEFTAICTKDGGLSGEHTIRVTMVNVTGIAMKSRQPKSGASEDGGEENQKNSSEDQWSKWNEYWVPTTLEKDDKLSLGFYYKVDGIRWIITNEETGAGSFDPVQTAAVEEKLAGKYKVEWSSSPNDLGVQQSDDTYEYTASILKKPEKAEKKTFTVSIKDRTTNKVVWKASHTLTVTPNPLFGADNWNLINEAWETKEIDDTTGKLTGLTLQIKMSKEDYDKWKLKFESLDTGILQLGKLTVTEGEVDGENKTTVVKIPCTQKNFGRVWIKVTAQDDDKSSQTYMINLEDPAPTLISAATQTINKASTERSVQIFVSTSAEFPLTETQNKPDVSIQEVKNGKKDASEYFELTDVREVKAEEAAALLKEEGSNDEDGDSAPEPYIAVYSMKLGLKESGLSRVKAGNYTVKLKCKTTAAKDNEYTLSLTVKVTDVKPKVTFKQTGKVNLFYTDAEGAGTLQINTSEEITNVALKDYVDNKNSNKNADCHYELKQIPITNDEEGGEDDEEQEQQYEENVYQIVRKSGQEDGSLKKGILEYTVEGYTGTFQTTFTVATENKAPAIVLSTKSETLYPSVGFTDSWITMIDKATGESIIPTQVMWYTGKGQNRKEGNVPILPNEEFNAGDLDENNKLEITGNASSNKYGLFMKYDGNIVSRLQKETSYGTKADTINLEIKRDNWSKPVAVSYKLQVNTAAPKLALGKATLTLNKNADVYRGQQERTALRLKGFNDLLGNDLSWVSITGQDDKSKAELKGKDSSLVIMYWNDCGDVVVRFNDNVIAPGTYKYKISVGKHGEREYASTVLTVKIVDKAVKQSLKVTAKGSIDVLNREGTFISYTPKISNLTGTVVDGRLEGRDANLFDCSFEDGKLIVKAGEGRKYSTKITYEVHTVFRVQTEDWRNYEVSSDNDAKAKPFKIKVKQGKPKLTVTAVGGNTLYRQRDNSIEFRVSAVLGKQEIKIDDVQQTDYWNDLWMYYDWENQIVHIGIMDGEWGEIRKNGTYKPKFKVEYRDKAGDVKEAEIECPIVVR